MLGAMEMVGAQVRVGVRVGKSVLTSRGGCTLLKGLREGRIVGALVGLCAEVGKVKFVGERLGTTLGHKVEVIRMGSMEGLADLVTGLAVGLLLGLDDGDAVG